jgi:hypothetical protein
MNHLGKLGLVIAFASLVGCTTVVREPSHVVYREVPAPVVETVPVLPAGSHWVPGHWVWDHGNWRWIDGHVVQVVVPPMPRVIVEEVPPPPSPMHYYVRGHWRWNGNAWVWVHGAWMR